MDLRAPTTARWITRTAWAAAAVGTVVGQLHAVARGLSHPEDWQESPLTRAWAEPVSRLLSPLFTWSDPWTVYLTYGKIWTPVCVAFLLAALLVHRRRAPRGVERLLWRVVLAGYALMTVSVFGDYFVPALIEVMFAVGLVAMLVIGVGGAALGVLLLRTGFRPRATAVLLVAFLPGVFLITSVTSLGNALLPLAWAWAIAAQHAAQPASAGITSSSNRSMPEVSNAASGK